MSSTKSDMPVNIRMVDVMPRNEDKAADPPRDDEGLRTSEIRYRRLLEAARDGILILNATSLKITDANPFMTELLGYSRDEFLGKELWEMGFFEDKKASQGAFQELQANGYIRFEDLPLRTQRGESREVEFVSNVYEEDGNQVIQCNIRDITDRKRREEERGLLLESVQRAHAEADTANSTKDEFLAILSHELRTPLTSILGWSQMLSDDVLNDADSQRAAEVILRNARAQRKLIDDLLDISRIITGKLRLDVRLVELRPMINNVIDGLRPAAAARNIQLDIAFGSRISPIVGDPDRLQQIVWNLLTNAIKFTPKGGTVRVRLEHIASHVEITTSDTGPGIDPNFLPHVFDRFRQSDSSTTRGHGGLGLGLSIVRQLVELHGGTVTAESAGNGKGSTFKVILPIRGVHPELSEIEPTPPVIAGEISSDESPSVDGVRVLVVDDELDSRELVAVVLTARGAAVVSVGSASEALAELERQTFDVLISDIGLPLMDGYALIREIRKLPAQRGGGIPAAALTAYAGIEHRKRVLTAGYQVHLPKPVEPVELTTVVASLAGRSRKLQ